MLCQYPPEEKQKKKKYFFLHFVIAHSRNGQRGINGVGEGGVRFTDDGEHSKKVAHVQQSIQKRKK